MDDIASIAKGGLAAAAAIVAAIAFLWFKARQNRVEKDEEKRSALEAELKDANAKHSAALWGGYTADAIREKRRIDRLRRKLGYTKEESK